MINNIVERSALLLVLNTLKDDGIELSKIQKIPNVQSHIEFLRSQGIQITIENNKVFLKTSLYYDLYQSVPPEIRRDVEQLIYQIISETKVLDETTVYQEIIRPLQKVLGDIVNSSGQIETEYDERNIKWIKRNNKPLPIACIHCADAPCLTYGYSAFGTTDKSPALVCPVDIVRHSDDGFVTIDETKCTGCMLCISRCPIDAIFYKSGVASKREYANVTESNKYVEQITLPLKEKRELTEVLLTNIGSLASPDIVRTDIKDILDNFDNNMSRTKFNWEQDPYYIWVRNCLRELGFKASYTGSPGKLKRSDVTATEPFLIGIEVKSPAEGEISVGAIRQALDAKREVMEAYNGSTDNTYCAVIGQEIQRGAHTRARSWFRTYNVKIPLIRGRYLLYLLLKHKTTLPQNVNTDLRYLFATFYGWFGKDEFMQYFNNYFESRKQELLTNNISLVLPPEVQRELERNSNNSAIKLLERLRNRTSAEIERCFPDPERSARGGYSNN